MTDETSCTALSKIDGKYAKDVGPCCDLHDELYNRRAYRLWLTADWMWIKCAWPRGGAGHKAKTVAFGAALMSLGWFLYYDLDKPLKRIPLFRKFKEWLG